MKRLNLSIRMKLSLKFYTQSITMFRFYLLVMGVLSSALNFGILLLLNQTIQREQALFGKHSVWVYFGVLLASFLASIFFQRKILRITNDHIFKNEVVILRSIRNATLQKMELLGKGKVYTIIEDLRITSSTLPTLIISVINSLASIFMCLIYFILISPDSTAIVGFFIAIILITYFAINKLSIPRIKKLRRLNEQYYRLIDDALKGFKQIKMSSIRNRRLFEESLYSNRAEVRDAEIYASNLYLISKSLGGYGLLALIGVTLFVLPSVTSISYEQTISFVIILLFIGGPINYLLSLQPFYEKAMISKKRIDHFIAGLSEEENHPTSTVSNFEFCELAFEEVYFKYSDDKFNKTFEIGPINLTIKKGEIIFVVGGNGSGKSTFINILTGLYAPSKGVIKLNSQVVDNSSQQYRDMISAIFTDNYLFSQHYEDYSLIGNEQLDMLTKKMELSNLFRDNASMEHTRTAFSKGEGKRMSMILALMERRQLLVLDEWAADQDPYFRRYFYEIMLSDFRREMKTIVAVTHDDRYFKHADRVVEFNFGKIVLNTGVLGEQHSLT